MWLIVVGLGLVTLGLPPNAEEMARAFIFLLVVICYAGVWLALAMLFSIIFRSAATAALVTLGLWLFLTFIWSMLADVIGGALVTSGDPETSRPHASLPSFEFCCDVTRLPNPPRIMQGTCLPEDKIPVLLRAASGIKDWKNVGSRSWPGVFS